MTPDVVEKFKRLDYACFEDKDVQDTFFRRNRMYYRSDRSGAHFHAGRLVVRSWLCGVACIDDMPEETEAGAIFGGLQQDITLENVCFRYPNSEYQALKSLNITIYQSGERKNGAYHLPSRGALQTG